jgi:hypothetical protein
MTMNIVILNIAAAHDLISENLEYIDDNIIADVEIFHDLGKLAIIDAPIISLFSSIIIGQIDSLCLKKAVEKSLWDTGEKMIIQCGSDGSTKLTWPGDKSSISWGIAEFFQAISEVYVDIMRFVVKQIELDRNNVIDIFPDAISRRIAYNLIDAI